MSLDVYLKAKRETEVYSANITHNLNLMAAEAGLYEALWRPEEIGVVHARDLIEKLTTGLHLLQSEPSRFIPFNPENGWGDYRSLCLFVRDYLEACVENPDAKVTVWR